MALKCDFKFINFTENLSSMGKSPIAYSFLNEITLNQNGIPLSVMNVAEIGSC